MKKITALALILSIFSVFGINTRAEWQDDYPWAADGVNYCLSNGIIEGDENGNLMLGDNLTRYQMAKIISEAFDLTADGEMLFPDVSAEHWAYDYILAISPCMVNKPANFNGDETVTREEFAASMMLAAGLNENSVRNANLIDENFDDAYDVSAIYKKLFTVAVERAYINGYDGILYPKGAMTRAEICTLIYRVLKSRSGLLTLTWQDLGVRESYTPIIGAAQITVEQAQAWAKDMGAAQIFIDIAPTYWHYGELFGMRPEILYAQAAKETGFGKYGGAVKPEMNNWAGIKIKNPEGDRTEDHETFATPDDGVRAHFNHMGAYVGLAPIGEAHDRYYIVKSISWAGSIKNLEALGGRWCPDLYYGYSILHHYVEKMAEY